MENKIMYYSINGPGRGHKMPHNFFSANFRMAIFGYMLGIMLVITKNIVGALRYYYYAKYVFQSHLYATDRILSPKISDHQKSKFRHFHLKRIF